jgi:hypothetical protein
MDRFSVLPRNLLRYVAESLEASPLTITSLRSLCERRPTLYENQQWARNYLGLRDLDAAAEADLVAMLAIHAAEVAHADDLITSACHWLYDHRILIPGERRVQDWPRDAFATIAKLLANCLDVARAEFEKLLKVEVRQATRQAFQTDRRSDRHRRTC